MGGRGAGRHWRPAADKGRGRSARVERQRPHRRLLPRQLRVAAPFSHRARSLGHAARASVSCCFWLGKGAAPCYRRCSRRLGRSPWLIPASQGHDRRCALSPRTARRSARVHSTPSTPTRPAAPASRPAQSPSRARYGCAEGLPPRRKRDLARCGDGGGASLACLRQTPDPFAQLPQSLPRCALCRRYRLELVPTPRAADGNCDGREPAAVFRTEGESAARPERSCGVHRRPLALRDVWGQLLPHVLAARLPRPR